MVLKWFLPIYLPSDEPQMDIPLFVRRFKWLQAFTSNYCSIQYWCSLQHRQWFLSMQVKWKKFYWKKERSSSNFLDTISCDVTNMTNKLQQTHKYRLEPSSSLVIHLPMSIPILNCLRPLTRLTLLAALLSSVISTSFLFMIKSM